MDIQDKDGELHTFMPAPEISVTYQGLEHRILEVTAEVFNLRHGQELYPDIPLHKVLNHNDNVLSAVRDRMKRYDIPDDRLH